MRRYTILFLLGTLLIACEKEHEDENLHPCTVLSDSMEGTYNITVTSYPAQPSQEGEEKDILVFAHLYSCFDEPEEDRILFNNLFKFYDCSVIPLNDTSTFTITYEDGEVWAYAPLRGEGYIIDGVFHFEGFIISSGLEREIILDGVKTSQDRRSDSC